MGKLTKTRFRDGGSCYWKPFLLFFLCWGIGLNRAAAAIFDEDTSKTPTVPAPLLSSVDTVHFVIYDFSKGTLSGTQQLPIDRVFTLKVINVPDTVHFNLAVVHEIDARVKKEQFQIHGTNPPKPDTTRIQDRRLLLCRGPSPTGNKGEFNFIVGHLLPNRNYVFEFDQDSTWKLTEDQKKGLRAFLVDTLKKDPFVSQLFNRDMQSFFDDENDEVAYAKVKPSIQALNEHLKKLVSLKYPRYLLNDSILNVTNVYADAIDNIKNLHQTIKDDSAACTKDTASGNKLKASARSFGSSYKWYGLSDITTKETLQASFGTLFKDNCKVHSDDIQGFIDGIAEFGDSVAGTYIPDAIVNDARMTEALFYSYYLDIAKNAQRNVTLDLGAAYSWTMNSPFLYTMINIYFRPIDKSLPLWNTNTTLWDFLGSRFSLAAGVTLTPVDKPKVRAGILGNKGVLLGAGFRLLPWFKVTGGTLLYHGLNQDPLVTSQNLRWTPFVSLSIDVDVKTIFSSFPVINELLFK